MDAAATPPAAGRTIRILGVPMDLGASHRGTDMGPSALRIAGVADGLRRLGYRIEREQDLVVPAMETRAPADPALRFQPEILAVCTALAEAVGAALDDGALPLIYGGDHSIAMGSVAGVAGHLRRRGERLGLIWFDAHGDMNVPATSPSGNVHGMPLAHLLGFGDPALAGIGGFAPKVRPEDVVLIGLRDLDAGERRVIRDSGVGAYTMREIDERGIGAVVREAIERVSAGTAGFHLSFDVDGLDPEIAPGVGTPVPGGLGYREAHLFMECVADSGRMLSCEVVELNPILDDRNRSAELVRHLLLSAFGLAIL
ncbi:MAG: arginase [Planctomycetota bacterium]|nr:MAG: arginase [Planctomycetota bacterium]